MKKAEPNTLHITHLRVSKLPIPPLKDGKATQCFYRDDLLPGFGVRITSAGSKSYIVERRVNGKSRRITIGPYLILTADAARRQALQLLSDMVLGIDPVEQRQKDKAHLLTLTEVYDDYLLTRKDLKAGTIKDYQKVMDGAFSDWATKPISLITKNAVERKHRSLGERSHSRANNAMRLLRALCNHCMQKFEDADGHPLLVCNPVDRLSEVRAWFKLERRQTLIKAAQLADWYDAVMRLNNETSKDFFIVLILSGLRKMEAASLTWQDIDFHEKTLICRHTKNGRVHILPLSAPLLAIFERRLLSKTTLYIFPGKRPNTHLSNPKAAVIRIIDQSGVEFCIHDLRRTFITSAEKLNIPAYTLKALMNHKDPNDVTAGYIIQDVERLRVPMQQIADYFLTLFNRQDSIVTLDQRRTDRSTQLDGYTRHYG